MTIQCVWTSAFFPSLSLYLSMHGQSQAFCSWGGYSLTWHICSFLMMWIVSDFYEWGYHYLGHVIPSLWRWHKHHHRFYNPSPFAVIADEAPDQIVRSLLLLLFPVLLPTNLDVLFFTYAVFFYGHGIYMHAGHELAWPDAHHPWINTSYQHYLHHSQGAVGAPAHTGFFVKIWDQMMDGDTTAKLYKEGKCGCTKCCRERGERSLEAWQKLTKPDYSGLFSLSFWMQGLKGK